ncbi:hypothetical protein M3Y99_01336400 [Aphelenchoides fujianensis]|nr:hypothetical protein M3Y99_01336400 [Aphelenchoides fujianensis]
MARNRPNVVTLDSGDEAVAGEVEATKQNVEDPNGRQQQPAVPTSEPSAKVLLERDVGRTYNSENQRANKMTDVLAADTDENVVLKQTVEVLETLNDLLKQLYAQQEETLAEKDREIAEQAAEIVALKMEVGEVKQKLAGIDGPERVDEESIPCGHLLLSAD